MSRCAGTGDPMVQEVSAPASASQEDRPVGLPGPAAAAGGVPLDRLLTVVTLSPAEAVHVAGRLLESTDAPYPVDTAAVHHDRWVVAVTASGDVEATPAGSRAGAPVAELLGQLVHSARRLPAHPTSGQLRLLRRLEEAAAAEPAAEPGAWPGRLQKALVEVVGADAPERMVAQLADLVRAYSHMAVSSPAPTAVPAAPGEPRSGPQPPGPRRSRGMSRRPRRAPARRAVLAVLLLVVAVAGSGYLLTRPADDASAGADRPRAAAPTGKADADTSSTTEGQGSAQPRPRVETLAPRSAGAITGVELQPGSGCAPGALCAVTVTARFRPAPSAQVVTWRVGTATSCKGRPSWSAPISVTAQPGWTRVYASSSVQVPRRPAVALVATTTAPARAQSSPVPVTGSSLRC